MKDKLEQSINAATKHFEGGAWEDVVYAIVDAAAMFFTYSEWAIGDFCVQSVSSSVIVFGGLNRLTWSVKHGFQIDRSFCSTEFSGNYVKVMASLGQSA